MKIEYQDFKIEDVMRFFAAGFRDKPQKTEWFYDPNKGIVIFRLFIKDGNE